MKLVLVIIKKAPPNQNKLKTYILIKNYNIISRKLNSNMLVKWTNM